MSNLKWLLSAGELDYIDGVTCDFIFDKVYANDDTFLSHDVK